MVKIIVKLLKLVIQIILSCTFYLNKFRSISNNLRYKFDLIRSNLYLRLFFIDNLNLSMYIFLRIYTLMIMEIYPIKYIIKLIIFVIDYVQTIIYNCLLFLYEMIEKLTNYLNNLIKSKQFHKFVRFLDTWFDDYYKYFLPWLKKNYFHTYTFRSILAADKMYIWQMFRFWLNPLWYISVYSRNKRKLIIDFLLLLFFISPILLFLRSFAQFYRSIFFHIKYFLNFLFLDFLFKGNDRLIYYYTVIMNFLTLFLYSLWYEIIPYYIWCLIEKLLWFFSPTRWLVILITIIFKIIIVITNIILKILDFFVIRIWHWDYYYNFYKMFILGKLSKVRKFFTNFKTFIRTSRNQTIRWLYKLPKRIFYKIIKFCKFSRKMLKRLYKYIIRSYKLLCKKIIWSYNWISRRIIYICRYLHVFFLYIIWLCKYYYKYSRNFVKFVYHWIRYKWTLIWRQIKIFCSSLYYYIKDYYRCLCTIIPRKIFNIKRLIKRYIYIGKFWYSVKYLIILQYIYIQILDNFLMRYQYLPKINISMLIMFNVLDDIYTLNMYIFRVYIQYYIRMWWWKPLKYYLIYKYKYLLLFIKCYSVIYYHLFMINLYLFSRFIVINIFLQSLFYILPYRVTYFIEFVWYHTRCNIFEIDYFEFYLYRKYLNINKYLNNQLLNITVYISSSPFILVEKSKYSVYNRINIITYYIYTIIWAIKYILGYILFSYTLLCIVYSISYICF